MILRMMKCEFILLLVLKTIIAVTVKNVKINNFELEYSVTNENWCISDKDRFQFIVGISIEQCLAECGARKHCSSLNYRNQIIGCELFLTSEKEQPIPGECVYVNKDNINVKKSPCQGGCPNGQVCESTSSKKGMCKIKECINTNAPTNGTVLGNLRGVGDKIRYMCNPGYEPKNDGQEPEAVCLGNGQWSHVTQCVKTNYTWASWSPWSTCCLSCESGRKSRTRECSLRIEGNGASNCDKGDVDVDNSTCNNQSCPTNYTWDSWSQWSKCSLSCGSGSQSRRRKLSLHKEVNDTSNCDIGDDDDENRACNKQLCPTPTHGKNCSSKTDCIETEAVCIQGICFCDKLFAYNNESNNCTKVCDTLTGNYSKINNTAISGFNRGNDIVRESLEECKTACNNDPFCLSFEIWQQEVEKWQSPDEVKFGCTIGLATYDMINSAAPTLLNNNITGCDLYSKKCS